jgi:hypothetical protein
MPRNSQLAAWSGRISERLHVACSGLWIERLGERRLGERQRRNSGGDECKFGFVGHVFSSDLRSDQGPNTMPLADLEMRSMPKTSN